MNDEIQGEMRKKLAESTNGFGFGVGLVSFFVLVTVTRNIIGIDLEAGHKGLAALFLLFSIVVGWVAGKIRSESSSRKAASYDLDTLKYKYDEFSRKKLRSNIITIVIVALIAGYFIFRR